MRRVHDRLLALVGKTIDNITTLVDTRFPLYGCVDGILTPAANHMMLEVGSGQLVGFVLITLNTSCRALKQVRDFSGK
jgi:hypothetical protein